MTPRVMIVLPTRTYRAAPFLQAARRLGVDVVVASDEPSSLLPLMRDRYVTLDLGRPAEAAQRAAAFAAAHPVDAVLGVDESSVLTAAHIAAALHLAHNRVSAVAATRDKRRLREALSRAGVPQPAHVAIDSGAADGPLSAAAATVGFPCVVKPVDLAASRGVIRADDGAQLGDAIERVGRLLAVEGLCGPGPAPLLLERFVPGPEIALECIVVPADGPVAEGAEHAAALPDGGTLHVLAVFDKPDPLDGPFFEETLYVTPSRHSDITAAVATAAAAVAALGITSGPVHAEMRLARAGPVVIEVAARSIGGLCSTALRFGDGAALEEVILRQALGLSLPSLRRHEPASGVLMMPTPRAGVLIAVEGVENARRLAGIDAITISVPLGERVVPLPEGDRYLGFVVAHGEDPAAVETLLRAAQRGLRVVVDGDQVA